MHQTPQINPTNSQLLNYTFDTLEEATQCTNRVPDAICDWKTVTVPWTDGTASIMGAHGYKAASPILDPRRFTFSGKWPPFPHQTSLANDIVVHPRFFALAEQGTGKTYSAIWAAKYLLQIGVIKRVLIVAPLSILTETWANSLRDLALEMPFTILHHTNSKKRLALAQLPTVWHVTNFDGVKTLQDQLVKNQYDLVIVDELRTYSSATTARWKALNAIIKRETRVVGLTGTPRPRSALDVYGQVRLIQPGNISSSFVRFRDEVMVKSSWNAFEWSERPTANAVIAKAMAPSRVIRKADVLKDLPPVTISYRYCPLSEQQTAYYKVLLKNQTVGEGVQEITAVNAAVLASKLLQVAAGSVYNADGDHLQFNAKSRIDEMLGLIEESASATLVFCAYKHTVAMLEPILRPLGFDVVTGDTKNRGEIFARLQAGQSKGILAIASTMSHGVTATKASSTIWFGPGDSSEIFLQANARTDRPGQTLPVSIYCLYGSQAERERYLSLQDQRSGQEAYLNEHKNFMKEFT